MPYHIRCVLSAFKYIHGLGVAYRDLKPENLLMDAEGYLKVRGKMNPLERKRFHNVCNFCFDALQS